jgi:ABC-type phosphate transport system substrate-binding protein
MSSPLPKLRAPRRPSIPALHRTLAITIALGAALAFAACTLLVNRSTVQCNHDSDCAQYGNHPFCQNNVCVPSGLEPNDCFYPTDAGPEQPTDFLNQCSSTAACVSFDNCTVLGICCDKTHTGVCEPGEFEAGLLTPPDASLPATTTPATTTADPDGGDGGPAPLPSCQDPTNGRANVIYMTGSSNFPPLLQKLAPLIAMNTAPSYTVIYQVTNSCTGVSSVFDNKTISDPAPSPSAKYAQYVVVAANGATSLQNCTLGPQPVPVDVGESYIFSTTCDSTAVPGGAVDEYFGPIQAMVFVVPGKSTQTSISAEAARAVFGTGGGGFMNIPWNTPALYFVRNASTGTQQMIGKAIGVPPAAFWGFDRGSAANVDAQMRVITDEATANKAIGIISADYYDSDRSNLNALAFKATQQDCAYLPDSTAFKTDKQNVRDGHYPIWGPLHFFAAVDGNGDPVSPAAAAFVSVVSVPKLSQGLLGVFIQSSLVPTCAMQVQRTSELGPLSEYSPPSECTCFFEASVSGATAAGMPPPDGCTACMSSAECPATKPACNFGYCEVQ